MEPHQADSPGNGKTPFWKKGLEALRRWGGGSLKLLVLALLLFAYFLAEETEAKIDDSVFLGALAIFSLWAAYGYLTRLLRYFFRKNAFRGRRRPRASSSCGATPGWGAASSWPSSASPAPSAPWGSRRPSSGRCSAGRSRPPSPGSPPGS